MTEELQVRNQFALGSLVIDYRSYLITFINTTRYVQEPIYLAPT